MEQLTRRSFVTTAAALGAAAAASSMIASNAVAAGAPADLNPQDWSYDSCTVADFGPLFEPLQIGKLTLRNRFVKSPAGSDTWVATDNEELNEGFLSYYENFAKGGAAMVFMEIAISKLTSLSVAEGQLKKGGWLYQGEKSVAEKLAPLPERIHKHGAYAGIQLSSPSFTLATATKEDLALAQDTMAWLCQEYKAAGFDIVEMHVSAGQLMKNMFTKRFNTREDEYGAQNVENRTRFVCEAIKKIKAACGEDFPIQMLMDGVEENDTNLGDNENYFTLEDQIANAKMFEAAGADTIYLRISVPGRHVCQFAPDLMFSGYKMEGVTSYGTRVDFSQHFDGMVEGRYSGTAMVLKCAEAFKKELNIPVSCAGCMDPRLAPDLIVNAVKDGKVDYLMMTRALTVEPELPNLLQAGRRDEIAPCTHCMHCHNKGGNAFYTRDGGAEYCRVNAKTQLAFTAAMPEGYEVLPAAEAKNVMVIGGGPAGMEAARIAAQRGHNVKLYEKNGMLGGLLPIARAYKGDHERLGDLADYLAKQQDYKGVEVITGVEVTPELVASEAPDAVIVAVGGKREAKFAGTANVPVYSFDEVPGAELGEKVVILGAGAQAFDVANWLVANGKKVQMVHDKPASEVAREQSMWVRTFTIPQAFAMGTKIWHSCTVDGITDEGVAITMPTGVQKVLACDSVIEIYDMVQNLDLNNAIAATGVPTYAVGDCNEPWNIGLAIRSGNLTARTI